MIDVEAYFVHIGGTLPMGFNFSAKQEQELERLARERGSKVTKVNLPVIEMATKMQWSEEEFSSEFEKLFKSLGYTGYHTWMSIRSKAGFPDWVIARPGRRAMFVELKKQKGKLDPEQEMWRDLLLAAEEIWFCWKPADWEFILETLK